MKSVHCYTEGLSLGSLGSSPPKIPQIGSSILFLRGALMKAKNPPKAYLEKAQSIEKYLAPGMIASIYATIAVLWAVLISLVFAALVSLSAATPTPVTLAIYGVLAFVPSATAVAAWFVRPNDPVSACIAHLAATWRKPLSVVVERCTFKTVLMSGQLFSIQVAFYHSFKGDNRRLNEQLYTFARAALFTLCSMRLSPPSRADLEAAMEPALEIVASEFKLTVLYSDVLETYGIQETYEEEELVSA